MPLLITSGKLVLLVGCFFLLILFLMSSYMIHLLKFHHLFKDWNPLSSQDSYTHQITTCLFVDLKNCIPLILKNMVMSLPSFYNLESSLKIQWKNQQKYHGRYCYKKCHLFILWKCVTVYLFQCTLRCLLSWYPTFYSDGEYSIQCFMQQKEPWSLVNSLTDSNGR